MFYPEKIFFILILFLAACGNHHSAVNVDTVKPVVKVVRKKIENFKPGLLQGTEIVKKNDTPFDDAYGKSGDTIFICAYKGKISWRDSAKTKTQSNYILNLNAEFMIDKTFIIPLQHDEWFVSWQVTDHEGVKSYCAVFKTGVDKPIWKLLFPVPNPGMPVLDGKSVYVTYLGIAAKVSVDDGKIIWKRDSLFNIVTEPFKNFEKPRVFENKIEFVDFPRPGHREKRDTLRVDPETGENTK